MIPVLSKHKINSVVKEKGMLKKFSWLAALEVVILITSSAATDEHFINMTWHDILMYNLVVDQNWTNPSKNGVILGQLLSIMTY